MLIRRHKLMMFFRFLSAGVSIALFQLITFITLFYGVDFEYLLASGVAFTLTVIVSFFMQKDVVFAVKGPRAISTRIAFLALCINSVLGLGVNCLIMYFGVEYLLKSEVFWQVVSMIFLAIYNFFIYQFLFRPRTH